MNPAFKYGFMALLCIVCQGAALYEGRKSKDFTLYAMGALLTWPSVITALIFIEGLIHGF